MHDPSTQAFDIKLPFGGNTHALLGGGKWRYRPSILTIWHKDPEDCRGRICRRSDDTCGWAWPNFTPEEIAEIEKLAKYEYSCIFEKQHREAEGADYASVCYVPTVYDAIYWSWRAIKHAKRKGGWKYGEGRNALTPDELQAIYHLASNPVDNLRHSFSGVKDEETFRYFFKAVHRCYMSYHRPWYKHPRWHVHHWRIQFHPWQALRRRFWDKCSKCEKRGFKPEHGGACGNWSGTEIWHSTCTIAHERSQP